jgi:hypothetical protein
MEGMTCGKVLQDGGESEEELDKNGIRVEWLWLVFDLSGTGEGVEMAEAAGVDNSDLAVHDHVAREVDMEG